MSQRNLSNYREAELLKRNCIVAADFETIRLLCAFGLLIYRWLKRQLIYKVCEFGLIKKLRRM